MPEEAEMSFRDRFRDAVSPPPVPQPGIAGLAEYAAGQGWTPRPDDPAAKSPFDGAVRQRVRDIAKDRAGGYAVSVAPGLSQTRFHDAYSGRLAGREFIAGNAYTSLTQVYVYSVGSVQFHGMAVMPVLYIDPARRGLMARLGHPVPISPGFDAHFDVHGVSSAVARQLLTGGVQALLTARDDWRFWATPGGLVCVSDTVYGSGADLTRWLTQLAEIAEALEQAAAASLPAGPTAAAPGLLLGELPFTGSKIDRAALRAQIAALTPDQLAELREQGQAQLRARGKRHDQ